MSLATSLPCREWCVVVVIVIPVLLLGIFATKSLSQSGTLCPPVSGKPSCVCQSSKGLIDLTPLGNKDKPRFADIQDPGNAIIKYTFNPCYKVKATDVCSSDYACCTITGGTSFEISGEEEKMYIDSDAAGTPYLFYQGDYSVKVNLRCTDDKNPKIVMNGCDDNNVYTFTLSSCHACPGDGCPVSPGGGGGGGGGGGAHKKVAIASGYIGIIVILLFIVLIAVYFIGGGIFLRVRKGPGADVIPHKYFWKELPILIKEGCVLTCTGTKSLVTCCCSRGYNKI